MGSCLLWRPSKPKGYLEDGNERCGDMRAAVAQLMTLRCPICSLRSKQHGSYNALSLLASQSSSELSPPGPLPASSLGASGTLFARLRPSWSGESGGGGGSGWGPRLAEHLHLGGRPRRSGDDGSGTLQGGGGSGVGEAFSDEEPSSGQHSSGRLPAGMMDEQLMPRAAAAEGSPCDRPFGGPPRPSSPLQRSGLTISVGQRPASAGPKACADAAAQTLAPGDPRRAPLPPSAGGTPRRSFSREVPPAEQGPPRERPQRGSSAALEALLGSGGGSPDSPLANASQQGLGACLSPPRSPAPGGPPQQRPQRDYEQPAVLRSPKRGGSGRLTRGGSGTLSALRVSTSASSDSTSSDSTAFGLLSAAASQLQEKAGSGGGFTIWPGAHSGGTSPSSARALGVSSSDSLAAGSGSSSASGSADYTSRFSSLSAEYARMAQITGASWVHLLPLSLTIVIQQPGSHHRCIGFPSWLGVLLM